MATDFFERQSNARRNTRWLMIVFSLSVIAIVASTFIVTAFAVGTRSEAHDQFDRFGRPARFRPGNQPFPWQIPIGASLASLALIAGGSMFKIAQLSSGGTGVAERLGGRRIYPNTIDPVERRLLNVVEEMALASGVPVPPVYMLTEEKGINAFAAGFSPSDAVIAVTRGTAQQLTRDQLQGVIGHEFSHILNGDMRLNLRMIGILFGILLLGLCGRELFFIAGRTGAYYGGDRKRGDGIIYLVLIGLALMILGFLGSFLGNLIKAAVSRQREFLADASSVQFTRNPEGISGALKRIGSAIFGSHIENPRAAEVSHMYFASGVSGGIAGLLATHPPLGKRILAIDPRWDGKFPPPLPEDAVAGLSGDEVSGLVGGDADAIHQQVPVAVVRRAADQVGDPTEAHRQYAAELIASLPQLIVDAAHEPYGARAVIFASLMDQNPQVRAAQLAALQATTEPHVVELTQKLQPLVDGLDPRAQLPLVDMTLPALRALSSSQYQAFTKCFMALVQADKRLSLFEWTLHKVLLRHLRPQFEPVRDPQIQFYGLQKLGQPCSVLLSTLARASQCDDQAAFDAGARELTDVPLEFLPPDQCRLDTLQTSLDQLSHVAAKHRQRLVDASAACICADEEVQVEEAELLRSVCDMLDCPMPPLLPGQHVSSHAFAHTQD
jgi:Zn-dependent protease with chaperone function